MRITVVCNLKYPTANYDSPVGCQQKALPQLELSGDCLHDLILIVKVTCKENIIHIYIFGISILMVSDLQYMMFGDYGWREPTQKQFDLYTVRVKSYCSFTDIFFYSILKYKHSKDHSWWVAHSSVCTISNLKYMVVCIWFIWRVHDYVHNIAHNNPLLHIMPHYVL